MTSCPPPDYCSGVELLLLLFWCSSIIRWAASVGVIAGAIAEEDTTTWSSESLSSRGRPLRLRAGLGRMGWKETRSSHYNQN